MLRFRNADLRPVLEEVVANTCKIAFVKDHGVYFVSEKRENGPDGTAKNIAYAVGCNPKLDPFDDWWNRAFDALGGDDFVETLDPKDPVFIHILNSANDLELAATDTNLSLRSVPPQRDKD